MSDDTKTTEIETAGGDVHVGVELGGPDGQSHETQGQKNNAARFALVAWVATHPRTAFWLLMLLAVPYLLLCWGAALVVVGAMFTGGCGG